MDKKEFRVRVNVIVEAENCEDAARIMAEHIMKMMDTDAPDPPYKSGTVTVEPIEGMNL